MQRFTVKIVSKITSGYGRDEQNKNVKINAWLSAFIDTIILKIQHPPE